jgi:hypothetical protein
MPLRRPPLNACRAGARIVQARCGLLALLCLVCRGGGALAQNRLDALLRAYPEALDSIDGDDLVWRDGTRMKLGTTSPAEDLVDALRHGTIMEQLMWPYPAGESGPLDTTDPGRIRNRAFFDKMYGDCQRAQVVPKLVSVVWLPTTWGHSLQITSVNGVAGQLSAVSQELDALPAEVKRPLYPPGGTYTCRTVRDTGQPSMHGWGAAIDINPSLTAYWMWGHRPVHDIDPEIVRIFEAHGFIWGGKWAHFDTMHFEYRPELLQR